MSSFLRRKPMSSTVAVRTALAAALAMAVAAFAAPSALAGPGNGDQQWVATWATAQVSQAPSDANRIDNQTLRQIVHVSAGGVRVRVKLSNEFGTGPLVVGAAAIALRDAGEAILPETEHALTFSGNTSFTLPPGAPVLSDPVDLEVPELSDLAIDLYLPGDTSATTSPITTHTAAYQTNYVSTPGDFTGVTALPVSSTRTSWLFLTGVEVMTSKQTGAVVTFGDSITDGTASTPDTNHRWPDDLARRIMAQHGNQDLGVLDVGIAGNRILHDIVGPNALARFDRDVLARTGVTHVTVLEGINDIGFSGFFPSEAVTADQIIEGHRQLIRRAHARGLKIYGCTLTPFEGAFPGYYTPEGEVKRETVNTWIRTSGEYDAVIDFDAVVRDPAHPTQMLPAYDSGDHLHPNDTGYAAMANSIDLKLFK
jgi:lysophospholipase L1-like esterase